MPLCLTVLRGWCLGLLALPAAAGQFELPEGFEGTWSGIPEFNIMGPWSNNLTFSISKATNGDYLFQNMIPYDGLSMWAWQRFYVEGSGPTGGDLWYCNGFMDEGTFMPGTGARHPNSTQDLFHAFTTPALTDASVTFCMDAQADARRPWPIDALSCSGCECANWTLSLEDGELHSALHMAGAPTHTHSKHLEVHMARIGEAPPITFTMPGHGSNFSCDFQGRDAQPVTQSRKGGRSPRRSRCPFSFKSEDPVGAPYSSGYPNCYVVNKYVGYVLEWEVDQPSSLVHFQVSANAFFGDRSYVALGFRPLSQFPEAPSTHTGFEMEFGMAGADIVVGMLGGTRTMFAKLYTGPPEFSDALKIKDSAVKVENGRISLSFSRPLVGGTYNVTMLEPYNDILWAAGEVRDGKPHYHFNYRGLHAQMDWLKPDQSMHDPETNTNPWLFTVKQKCGVEVLVM